MKNSIYFYHHEEGHQHGKGHESGHHKNRTGGGFGPKGTCTCLKCGFSMKHQRGVKCTTVKCPECGHVLARKELVDQKKDTKKK